ESAAACSTARRRTAPRGAWSGLEPGEPEGEGNAQSAKGKGCRSAAGSSEEARKAASAGRSGGAGRGAGTLGAGPTGAVPHYPKRSAPARDGVSGAGIAHRVRAPVPGGGVPATGRTIVSSAVARSRWSPRGAGGTGVADPLYDTMATIALGRAAGRSAAYPEVPQRRPVRSRRSRICLRGRPPP